MSDQAEFKDAIIKFRADPVLFVRTLLKVEPFPHQAQIMRAVADGHRKVSIRSGRRIGKTTTMAWLSLWFEMTRTDARTIVTAPAASQLNDAYIPEFRKWVQRLPAELGDMWDVKAERFDFRMDPRQGFENFVTIRTARKDSPESLQGINAPNVLILPDEASGIDDPHFEALSGSMGTVGAFMVLTGNPVRSSGYFYETHHALKDHWYTLHVNSEDVPSVSREWIAEMRDKYGRDSNAYRVHVLGEFPRGDDDTIIPADHIESAVNRPVIADSSNIIWGVDVARFGSDRSALSKRAGKVLMEPVRLYDKFDLMMVTGFVKNEWDATDARLRPFEIMVDAIGMGGGVADRLREQGLPARDVNVSELPSIKSSSYHRLGDELWFRAKDWFAGMDVSIPNDTKLQEQLKSRRFGYASSGALKVESKDDMRRRGLPSPDGADSFVLTFATNAASSLRKWRRAHGPLKRNIRGIV